MIKMSTWGVVILTLSHSVPTAHLNAAEVDSGDGYSWVQREAKHTMVSVLISGARCPSPVCHQHTW